MTKRTPNKKLAPNLLEQIEADKAKNISRKYSRQSTRTKAQIDRLASLLRVRPHHTYELRKMGISHPAGRVDNLEELGYVIGSDRINCVDGDGFLHCGVALYSMVSEPHEVQPCTE